MILLALYVLGLLTIFVAAGATKWFGSGCFEKDASSDRYTADKEFNQAMIIGGIIVWPITLPAGLVLYLCYLVCSKAVNLGMSLRKKLEEEKSHVGKN